MTLTFGLLFFANQPVYSQQYLRDYWAFETEIDPLDDSVKFTAVAIRKEFESQNLDLVIRCLNEIDMFISTEDTLVVNSNFVSVATRIGSSTPNTANWYSSTDQLGAFNPTPLVLLNGLMSAKSRHLAIRVDTSKGMVTQIFNLTGIKQVYQLLSEACGLEGLSE